MKIEVSEFEKKYIFELEPVTQICGQNIVKKTFILESIRRYFSTYKYREEKNKWRDNVRVDDKIVGRKFFTVLSLSSISDFLTMIRYSKQSLMMDYMKSLTQKYDWQLHLRTINEELETMFQVLNEQLETLGNVEISYDSSDVWDMIQKSNITGRDQTVLEDQNNYEILMTFLNLLDEVLKVNPKKMLVLFENIDHLITSEEYLEIIRKLQNIAKRYDIYFILSVSLDGYPVFDKELCTGVNVFTDLEFQMPEFDRLLQFVIENYPCNKMIPEEQLGIILKKIVHKIGQKDYLFDVEDNVVCKLINKTLLLNEKWSDNENLLEIAFLKA